MPGAAAPDEVFVEAFGRLFLGHLKGDPPLPDSVKENRPRDMIAQAGATVGKLSRIFDTLAPQTPINVSGENSDRANLLKAVTEGGGLAVYLAPTITKIADVVLTPDKTRLQDSVIEAIGIEEYATIVGGKVEGDRVVSVEGNEQEFAKKEADVANNIMSAAVMCYVSSATDRYELTPENVRLKNLSFQLQDPIDKLRKKCADRLKQMFLAEHDEKRVSTSVIDAIGMDKYARLVGGKVDDGKVVPLDEGGEIEFNKKQEAIYYMICNAINERYDFTANSYFPSNIKPSDEDLSDLVENLNSIMDKVEVEQLGELTQSQESVKIEEKDNEQYAQELINKANLEVGSTEDPRRLSVCCKECCMLQKKLDDITQSESKAFLSAIYVPGNELASSVKAAGLDGISLNEEITSEDENITCETICERIIILQRMLENFRDEANRNSIDCLDGEKEKYTETINEINITINKLTGIRELYEDKDPDFQALYGNEELRRDDMLKKYDKVVKDVASSMEVEKLNPSNPPKLRSMFYRVCRALATLSFSLTTKVEKEAIKAHKVGTELIDKMKSMKERLQEAKSSAAPEPSPKDNQDDLRTSPSSPHPH